MHVGEYNSITGLPRETMLSLQFNVLHLTSTRQLKEVVQWKMLVAKHEDWKSPMCHVYTKLTTIWQRAQA